MKPGIYAGLPETAYFADPALSSTEARWLLDSPARYRYEKDHKRGSNDAFNFGSAVHSKVLGTGWPVEVLDFDSYRTKAAQQARDDAYANELVPILKAQADEVEAVAEAVLAHPTARALFEAEGQAEASVFATDPVTGVNMKARFDFLGATAVDLKTTAGKASPDGFAKSVASFRYDIQSAHYLDTLANATGEDREFYFVVAEKTAPFLVGVYRLSDHFNEIGSADALRARELYAECMATGEWPGYGLAVQEIAPPTWLAWQHEALEADIEVAS